MTRNQQEEDKKTKGWEEEKTVRDELKSLKAAGVTNVKISKGKVICMENDSESQKVWHEHKYGNLKERNPNINLWNESKF